MKLINLLELVNEESNVKIFDYMTGETLAEYDGKNSIDTELNELDVVSIGGFNDALEIIVMND